MKKLTIFALALAFCLPAQAELLVFKTSTIGQQFEITRNLIERKNERGYLVIDADLSNPDSIIVNDVYHLHYENKAGIKSQYTTHVENMEILLIASGASKKMLLRYFDESIRIYQIVYGTASVKDIGSGTLRTLASSLTGHAVWREPDYITGSGSFKLRLDTKATRNANIAGKTITQVIDEYTQMLVLKGYSNE
jgi:hypothetical protein